MKQSKSLVLTMSFSKPNGIENLGKISDLVSLLLVIYTILFAIACSFISFASIRIAIEDQLVEIKVMRLVGATMAQIKRPFLYCGAVYGLMGGFWSWVSVCRIGLGL